jgi:hypothetical protein
MTIQEQIARTQQLLAFARGEMDLLSDRLMADDNKQALADCDFFARQATRCLDQIRPADECLIVI